MSLALARAVLATARANDFATVVHSPGSRCAPLVIAARELGFNLHPVLDERAAGFFAVGLAKAGTPTIVVATSGTAIANWHPAAVEAAESKLPVLFLSADRPAAMLDSGANQTIDQRGILGPQLKCVDLDEDSWCAGEPEFLPPMHWNVRFEEPILRDVGACPVYGRAPEPKISPAFQPVGGPEATLVIGCKSPGPHIIHGSRILADVSCRHQYPGSGVGSILASVAPERLGDCAVQIGGRSTSLQLDANWTNRGARHEWVDGEGRFPRVHREPGGNEPTQIVGAAEVSCGESFAREAELLSAWSGASPYYGAQLANFFASLDEPGFVGNSLAIRDFDRYAITTRAPIYHNRGASGIDGNLATIAGLSSKLGQMWAWMGDLSFLHDATSCRLLRDSEARVVVVDDGGGHIFSHMPYATLPNFETDFLMPQDCDLTAIASAYGLRVRTIHDAAELPVAWGSDAQIIILRIDAAAEKQLRDADLERAAVALRALT